MINSKYENNTSKNYVNKFIPLDFYGLRIHKYALQDYLDKEKQGFLEEFERNQTFREAIFFASYSLYNTAMKFIKTGKVNSKKLDSSLRKYYKRMATRATPFGTFSAFSLYNFKEGNNSVNELSFSKKYRISSIWLYKIIDNLENDINIVKGLSVVANNNILYRDDRIYLYYGVEANTSNNQNTISIQYTKQIKEALEKSKDKIIFADIVKEFIDIYGISYKNKIENFLLNLIKSGFLITELRVENIDLNQIIKIIDSRKLNYIYLDKLVVINEYFEYLNNVQSFDETTLLNLIEVMESLYIAEEYIQVDSKIENTDIKLGKQVAYDLCEMLEWLTNNFGINKNISNKQNIFYSNFVDTFGYGVKVPLNKLYMNGYCLDDFENLFIKSDPIEFNNITNMIMEKYIDCIKEKNEEIALEDINIYKEDKDKVEFNIGDIEVYGRLYFNNNSEDYNDYTFVINNEMSSNILGASFGRFSDLIDYNKFKRQLGEKYNNEAIEYIQVFHKPQNHKIGNILREKLIVNSNLKLNWYSDNESIDINDISIIAKDNKLYLWSNKLNKQIKLVYFNMLNPLYLPQILRILISIENYNRDLLNTSLFNNLEKMAYSPRIKFKKIILKPMTWRIYDYFLENLKEETFIKYFYDFKVKYRMKKYVSLKRGDNKLFIDTGNIDDIKLLFKELIKEKFIMLEEICGMEKKQFVEIKNKQYFSEIVIPIMNKHTDMLDLDKRYLSYNSEKIWNIVNEYLYFKLYVNFDKMNIVLTKYLFPIINTLLSEEKIYSMYFIRYKDNFPHIRVRIKGNEKNLLSIIPIINNMFNKLYTLNLASDLSFNTYFPEISRYGGEEYFPIVEEYFFKDSMFVLSVLCNIEDKKVTVSKEIILVISILYMLKNMNINYNDCCKIINIDNINNKNLIDYRKYRRKIKEFIISDNNEYEENIIIRELINKKEYKDKLNFLNNISDKKYLYSIINSIIHMSCNRFEINDSFFEDKVRELLRCILRDLHFWKEFK